MRVRVLGPFESELPPELSAAIVERMPVVLDELGRISVKRVVLENRADGEEIVLVLTAADLAIKGCRSLFGYSDQRRRVAIVSTHLLADSQERLSKVIAHETGHLNSLCHCQTRQCVMYQARTVQELDERGLELCEGCRCSKLRFSGLFSAALFCAIVFGGMDGASGLFKAHVPPFSSRPCKNGAELLYENQTIFRVRDQRSITADRRAAMLSQALNSLFNEMTPPSLSVSDRSPSGATIVAGYRQVFELFSEDTGGGDPTKAALELINTVEPLLRGKGLEQEGCPSCHIRRMPEIQQAIRSRMTWRR